MKVTGRLFFVLLRMALGWSRWAAGPGAKPPPSLGPVVSQTRRGLLVEAGFVTTNSSCQWPALPGRPSTHPLCAAPAQPSRGLVLGHQAIGLCSWLGSCCADSWCADGIAGGPQAILDLSKTLRGDAWGLQLTFQGKTLLLAQPPRRWPLNRSCSA